MFYKTLVAFCLLLTPAFAEIKVEDTYKPNHPIVLTCEVEETENTDIMYEWTLPELKDSKGLRYIPLNEACFHVWGDPGTYDIKCRAIIQYKINLEVVIRDKDDPNNPDKYKFKVVSVVQRFEVEDYTKTFTVESPKPAPTPEPGPTPDPQPDPDPTPDPVPVPDPVDDPIAAEGFNVLIVEETNDRPKIKNTDRLMALMSVKPQLLVRKSGGYFRQTDDDSVLNYEYPRWADAIKEIVEEQKPLPWIVISNDKEWFEGELPGLNDTLKLIEEYKPEKK